MRPKQILDEWIGIKSGRDSIKNRDFPRRESHTYKGTKDWKHAFVGCLFVCLFVCFLASLGGHESMLANVAEILSYEWYSRSMKQSEKDSVAEVSETRVDKFILLPSLYLWHTFIIKWYLSYGQFQYSSIWALNSRLYLNCICICSTVSSAIFNNNLRNYFVHVKCSKTLDYTGL